MIDLHSHSTVSDGTDPPADVVALGAAAGLAALALTDHDTLDHLPEARAAAEAHGVRLVPGCEISCELGGRAPGSMHLLVYFVDDSSGPLRDRMGALQAGRAERNDQILESLRGHGIEITLDEVLAKAGPGSVGRPHIARVLMEKGYVASIQEAFDRWLAKDKPAYFERVRLRPEESIELAHASGGVTVVAHPGSLELEARPLDELVGVLAAEGLDGLECEYGRYTPDERAAYTELAVRHGLAVTGGSDYHGDNKPDLRVGIGRGDLAVPDELLDDLEARRP
ncbi:MAG: PHP domain-containing protein [Acidimicrobiia bacterium]